MISPIYVVPKGTVYCPKYRQEQNMHQCVSCPYYKGSDVITGYGAASCYAFKCIYK